MENSRPKAKIQHILCPTDLSEKSQRALGVSARLAETLHASLTACHCSPANWFTSQNRLPQENLTGVKELMKKQLAECQDPKSTLTWRSLVIENSFDPARDILNLARETQADLIVMKARPGVLSAFRFGSIVERIVEASPCPVLLLPASFLAEHDPAAAPLEFHRILFDYDFSDATDQLFRVVNALTEGYNAELRMLSVLEPTRAEATEVAPLATSRTTVQTVVRGKLKEILEAEGQSLMNVPATVEWGVHAETVLESAAAHKVDLICTALAPPHFYFEKFYRGYLGTLLRSARCPILVKQSAGSDKVSDF